MSEDQQVLQPSPVAEPYTVVEVVRDFEAVERWGMEFWRAFDLEAFFAPLGTSWSPADHVRHLTKANRPVGRALDLPRLVLLLRFGWMRRPSRPYTALRATYHEALGAGLQAGNFAPAPLREEQRSAEERERILSFWTQSLEQIRAASTHWSDRALDGLSLPHPGLGRLTVREMLFFTLYHNTHHVHGAARRPGGERT